MITEEDEEEYGGFRGFQPSLQTNIAHWLNIIFMYSAEEPEEKYYRVTRHFIRFLPRRVKKKMEGDIAQIEQRLKESASQIVAREDMDDLTAAQVLTNERASILREETDKLVDKITNVLDEEDMLEFKGIRPQIKKRGHLGTETS